MPGLAPVGGAENAVRMAAKEVFAHLFDGGDERVWLDAEDVIVGEGVPVFRVVAEDFEVAPVEAVQPVDRSDPEEAQFVFGDAGDMVVAQAPVGSMEALEGCAGRNAPAKKANRRGRRFRMCMRQISEITDIISPPRTTFAAIRNFPP